MGVGVRVDGLMVLAGVAVAGGALLYVNRNKFNPASEENVVHSSVVDIAGEENVSGFFEKLYGARELIIDWTYPGDYEASPLAYQTWGLEP